MPRPSNWQSLCAKVSPAQAPQLPAPQAPWAAYLAQRHNVGVPRDVAVVQDLPLHPLDPLLQSPRYLQEKRERENGSHILLPLP